MQIVDWGCAVAITVEIALKLPEMENMVIVAGSAGLSREISAVNMMDAPDISNYLKRGELLLTTMYPIRDNEELQRGLIPMLSEKGVAALAIAPLRKDYEIPAYMLRQAEELGFPILRVPYETPISSIMDAVLHCIIKRHYSSELIEDILSGNITSIFQALSVGSAYSWDLSGAFLPAVFQGDMPLGLPPDVIMAELNGKTLMIIPLGNSKNADNCISEIMKLAQKQPNTRIGIGRAIKSIMELPRGYTQAQQALKIAMRMKDGNIACY